MGVEPNLLAKVGSGLSPGHEVARDGYRHNYVKKKWTRTHHLSILNQIRATSLPT